MNSSLTKDPNLVNIYVRNYKKHAVILPLRTPLSGRQLRQKVKQRYLSQVKEFTLFFKGKCIEDNQTPVALQSKSIVHLIDLSRVNLPSLNIIFKEQRAPSEEIRIKVSPYMLFRDVLRDSLKPIIDKGQTQVFLVYLGKPINIFKRIEQQLIEDETEILIVQFKRKQVTQPSEKTQIEIINQSMKKESPNLRKTIVLGSPAMGPRDIQELEIKKTKQETFNAPSPAPETAAPATGQENIYGGNLAEISTAPPQNPEQGGPKIQLADSIFSASEQYSQTQNLISSAVKQLKASLKKSKGK